MKHILSLTFFISLITTLTSVKAQERQNEIQVISSKLINNQLSGGTTHIITKEDIQNYSGETLPQIISRLPGIEFKDLYGAGFGAYQSIDVRGFGDTSKSNTVILLNGQKLSNIDLSFVDFTNIPTDSVQRIEVIKGNSAGVLYGGNATAGAINIITDQLPDFDDKYSISTLFGSYGKFEGFLSGTKSINNFSVTGNSNYIVSDGYRRNNGLRQKNGNIEINGLINQKNSFHLNLVAHDQYIELPGDVPVNAFSGGALNGQNGFPIDPRSTDTPRDFATNYGQKIFFNTAFSPNENLELINDASYRFNKSQGFFFSTGITDTEMNVISYNPKVKLRNKLFGFSFDNISGIDLNYTYYRSDRMPTTGGATQQVYKFSDTNLGFYSNFESQIDTNNKIGAGARFQGNWLKASDFVGPASGAFRTNNRDSLTYDPQYALHLGYERNFNSMGIIFARIGRSFTYPNVDQRVGHTPFNVSHDFKLRTQTSNDYEIGHRFKNRNLSFHNTFYYMNLRSEIYYDSVDFLNKNLDPSKRYGFESSINYSVNSFITLDNSFTFAKAKMRDGNYKNNEIPGVPSLSNTFEITFRILEDLNFSTNLYYKGNTRMINDTRNFQVKMPEYYLLNMGLKGNVKGFKFTLLANNVLDKSYYNYAVASASTYNAYNTYPLSEFNMMFKLTKDF